MIPNLEWRVFFPKILCENTETPKPILFYVNAKTGKLQISNQILTQHKFQRNRVLTLSLARDTPNAHLLVRTADFGLHHRISTDMIQIMGEFLHGPDARRHKLRWLTKAPR